MKTLLITNPNISSQNHICQLIQQSWITEFQKDRRKIQDKDFLNESVYFKIIDSKEKFELLDRSFVPDVVFIVPELMWENEGVNEGYKIAKTLITHTYKNTFIQLVFLSVLDRAQLLNTADIPYKCFTESFPHLCLMEQTLLKFEYYSEIHFSLIKHLAISEHGRLQKIEHETSSINTNIKNKDTFDDNYKKAIIKQLEELSLFKVWTDKNINSFIENAKEISEITCLKELVEKTIQIINDIKYKLPKAYYDYSLTTEKKSGYKVFIIEDEAPYKTFFYNVFSSFYNEVYPDNNDAFTVGNKTEKFDITAAKDIIKRQGKNFDIFLLDLLYKDKNGNWLNFNGLDLFLLVRQVNPHAVIRIITSLPRGIVAKVVNIILNNTEKPNTDQVFTKKYGYEALKDGIIESIDKLNAECRAKEKLKTAWAPFPQKGVFEWAGVKNYLHNSIFGSNTDFENTVNNTLALFNSYLNNTLTKNANNWDKGILPKPAQKDKQDNALYIKEKLCSIMAHRLIVLNEALKREDHKIFYNDYLDIIRSFTGIQSINKGYFQTKLGFRGSEYKKEEDNTTHCFQLKLVNLFPHEKDFVAQKLIEISTVNENDYLMDFNPSLNNWFKSILTKLDTYENWKVFGLNFDPYLSQGEDIDNGAAVNAERLPPNLTVKNLRDFLMAINMNYREVSVIGIVNYITDNPIAEDNINDNVIANLVNDIYKLDLDNDNE